jgi:hypothetical protein
MIQFQCVDVPDIATLNGAAHGAQPVHVHIQIYQPQGKSVQVSHKFSKSVHG